MQVHFLPDRARGLATSANALSSRSADLAAVAFADIICGTDGSRDMLRLVCVSSSRIRENSEAYP